MVEWALRKEAVMTTYYEAKTPAKVEQGLSIFYIPKLKTTFLSKLLNGNFYGNIIYSKYCLVLDMTPI